jgi:putrescine transport system substrate-binding protein
MPRLLALLALILAPLMAHAEERITVYNWNDYIDPQVLVDFEKETGIGVDYHTYSTAEELEQTLASNVAIDIAVPSHDALPGLIEAASILPLDFQLLPNRSHLDKQLLSKLAAFDANNRYAIPYLWGSVGLAINTEKAEQAFGGPLPDSWSLLFNPEQSTRLASCGISVLDARDEVLSALLSYQGRSLARTPPSVLKRSGELLKQLRPNLQYVDSTRYIDDLANGKLCVAFAWLGDTLAASKAGQPVKFVVPKEGSSLFIDSLVIPTRARRPDLAHRFIDYLMQPKVAAAITTATLYPNANAHAKAFLEPAIRDLPGLYPDQDTKRRLTALETLPKKLAPLREQVWQSFIQAP